MFFCLSLDNGLEDHEEHEPTEANPSQGKVSYESPLGKALVGRKVGEEAKVNAPAGVLIFRVVDIQ